MAAQLLVLLTLKNLQGLRSPVRRRRWHPTPVLLPGKSHGWRSLVGCSPWGRKESDMTEQLHFHFSLSCIGEGNGNPLQCSCLENPRDGGAWWAAIYGVTQSRTRRKLLSSSSRSPVSGMDQKPSIRTKDAPCPLIILEITRDLAALFHELGAETNKYFLFSHSFPSLRGLSLVLPVVRWCLKTFVLFVF